MKLTTKTIIFSAITIVFLVIIAKILYQFTVINDYLLFGTSISLFIVLLYLFIEKITAPLHKTIEQLKQSNLYEEEVEFEICNTHEINELNKELNTFSTLNKEQYLFQRQYSENLSHELLTPLAVIRAKTELILQSPELRESDLLNLDGILQTVSRLSKVNQALILLSKISNNQFVDKEDVSLKQIINESLENFESQIRKKNISIRVDLTENEILNSNLNLLQILIGNLVKNAVFHNVDNGKITITLNNKTLIISNTGFENHTETDDFFKRFISDKKSNHSIGLGLAIVKQICLLFDYEINYDSIETNHQITVSFES
ncbi:MAG: signal transduction histidine kinase [Crocinitomix sp.]|jgi:signal transduction histidine kinase